MRTTLIFIPFMIFSATLLGMDDENSCFENIEFSCKICMSNETNEKLINIGCSQHDYCENCLRQYLGAQLDEGATTFKCPAPACQSVLNPPDNFVNHKKLKKNLQARANELDQQNNTSSYVWVGLFKGFLGCLFCCFNCCGRVSFSDIEVCPYCKEIFQFTEGCNAIYHSKCDHVFLKNSQVNLPCCDSAYGCYFPNPIACCCSYTYTSDGTQTSCNTCPSCWRIDL